MKIIAVLNTFLISYVDNKKHKKILCVLMMRAMFLKGSTRCHPELVSGSKWRKMLKQVQHDTKSRIPAFNLLELGLVLIIIGVLVGAVFKGDDLLQAARLNSVLDDVKRFRNAVVTYQQTYGNLPGNDPNATTHFNNVKDGNGNGIISGAEEPLAWQHLAAAGLLSHGSVPSSKMGGTYRITSNVNDALTGAFLVLGQGKDSRSGILTPKQAQTLKNKADDGKPDEGIIQFIDGEGSSGSCVEGNVFSLKNEKPACVLVVRLS